MTTQVEFRGTQQEKFALLNAIERNCTCEYHAESHARIGTCASHDMLVSDQRALDGLLWERHLATRRLSEEFGLPCQE